MNTQNYTVNIRVGLANPARVNISQGDTGRTLAFSLYDGLIPFTPPTGSTVTIVGRKPSKLGFTETCTVSGNVATVATTLAMTQEAGKFPAELRIEAGGQSIGTANFTIYIEPSPHPDGTTDGTHDTMDNLQTQITSLQTDIAELQNGGYVADAQQIQTKVNTYLADHPEIAVLDGSLTESKFSNALKLKTIKDYVTPEMFGAVGDGVTDDSDAIISAINADEGIVYLSGKYAVSKELIGDAKAIIGNNAEIVLLNDVDRVFRLNNAYLVTGLKFDCNNFGATICVFCSSILHEISNIEIYDLVDTRTNRGTQMIYSMNAENVTIHDVYVHDCSHIVNGIIADSNGNITCVYATNYTNNCTIYNVSVKEIHNVDANENMVLEDGGGIYVTSMNKNAETYIHNIYGYNYCKRLIKTQCLGCVIVDSVNAYSNSADHLVAIGIQSTQSELQSEYGKGIITNCHLVNEYGNGSTNQEQYLIASSENIIISNCYFESRYQYAIKNEGDIKINGCNFIGYAILHVGRSLSIDDCTYKGNGFLYNTNNNGLDVYISNCNIANVDFGGHISYPFLSNNKKPLTMNNCVLKKGKIRSGGELNLLHISIIDLELPDTIYLESGAKLTAYDLVLKAKTSLVRAINVTIGAEAVIKSMKTENFQFSVVGGGEISLGTDVDLSILYNQFSSVSNIPQYVDSLPNKSTMPTDGLYAILKTDGKLYQRSSGVWTAVN